jgi:hypothetical protein
MLNVARMKELVNSGEISGRDLHSKQEEFTMRANIVAASQYSFVVDTTDHGTWRRIRHYTSKTKFSRTPDKNNPLEKLEEQKFVRDYPTDPHFQSAILSILTHYYERLQNEYGGELKNVNSPTIESETEKFRVGQDAIHRWVSETIVVSPNSDKSYDLSVLKGFYTEWYAANVGNKSHCAKDVFKEIESSVIGKYLKPSLNTALALHGCRVLTKEDKQIREDETLISGCQISNRVVAPELSNVTAWWGR